MPPDDDKDDKKTDEFAVKFKTEGEYLASVDRKLKSKVKSAVDEAVAGVLAKLGVESVDDIDGLVGKVKSSEGAATEADKLKSTLDKTLKKLADAEKATTELKSFRKTALIQKALMAHASKGKDPEVLEAMIASRLVVGDDDSVTGPDGMDVGKMVDEFYAAKPYLKSADFKEGAGTKPTTQKINVPFQQPDEAAIKNGAKPLTAGQAIMNDLVSKGVIPAPAGGGGP